MVARRAELTAALKAVVSRDARIVDTSTDGCNDWYGAQGRHQGDVAPLVADEITELTGNTLNDFVTDHDGHILREFDTPLTSLSCVLIFPSGFWRKFMQPGPGRGLQSEIGKDG